MFCTCKQCKKARREGLVLGTRYMGYWLKKFCGTTYEYYYGPVSAYVKFPKFGKGRRPNDKFDKNDVMKEY